MPRRWSLGLLGLNRRLLLGVVCLGWLTLRLGYLILRLLCCRTGCRRVPFLGRCRGSETKDRNLSGNWAKQNERKNASLTEESDARFEIERSVGLGVEVGLSHWW